MVNAPWNPKSAKDAMDALKKDHKVSFGGASEVTAAKIERPPGIKIKYELQDDELRWLRDTYNGMDFLSGHFKSDYHTVGPPPLPPRTHLHAHLHTRLAKDPH